MKITIPCFNKWNNTHNDILDHTVESYKSIYVNVFQNYQIIEVITCHSLIN